MERFDITIQMYSADASGTQYVWEKVPAEEGDFVLYADAQATIAALQARAEQAERLVALQAQEILQRRQTLGDLAHLHQQQSKELTQRTAELEAAKRGIDTARTRYDNLSTESYKQIAVLQAELERVRGELQKAERCISEWVDRHSTYFSKLEIDFAKPERRLSLCRGQDHMAQATGEMSRGFTRTD